MKKRSIKIAGHATSVTLEDEFWTEFKAIAITRGESINTLIEQIDEVRTTGLSSAVRVFVLKEIKSSDYKPSRTP